MSEEIKATVDELKNIEHEMRLLLEQKFLLEEQLARLRARCRRHEDLKSCRDDDDCLWLDGVDNNCTPSDAHQLAVVDAQAKYKREIRRYEGRIPRDEFIMYRSFEELPYTALSSTQRHDPFVGLPSRLPAAGLSGPPPPPPSGLSRRLLTNAFLNA